MALLAMGQVRKGSSLPKLEEGALFFTFLDSAGGEGVFLVILDFLRIVLINA